MKKLRTQLLCLTLLILMLIPLLGSAATDQRASSRKWISVLRSPL